VLNDIQKKTQYDRLRMQTPSSRVRMSTSTPKAPTAPATRQYESARQRMREESGRPTSGYGYRPDPGYRSAYEAYASAARGYARPPDSESSTRAHSGHTTTPSGWSKAKAADDFGYARERKSSTSNPKMRTHKGSNLWNETSEERRRSPPLRREGASSTGPHVGSAGHYAYMQDRARSRGASPQPWQERTSAPYSYTPGEKYSYTRP